MSNEELAVIYRQIPWFIPTMIMGGTFFLIVGAVHYRRRPTCARRPLRGPTHHVDR